MISYSKRVFVVGLAYTIALLAVEWTVFESTANSATTQQLAQKKTSRQKSKKRKRSKRRSRKSDRRKKLAQQRNSEKLKFGWVEYRGKIIAPDKFQKRCKKVGYKDLTTGRRNLNGFAVQLEGQLQQSERGVWQLLITQDKQGRWKDRVLVNATKMKRTNYRPGQVVHIWGVGGEGPEVEAWFSDLVPPGVAWKFGLRIPRGGIVGGAVQTFYVDGRVKNVGKQPIQRLRVAVRLYQVQSPNDWIETLILENVAPGQSRNFTVPFEIYNFTYIGATSIPNVEMTVLDYEL